MPRLLLSISSHNLFIASLPYYSAARPAVLLEYCTMSRYTPLDTSFEAPSLASRTCRPAKSMHTLTTTLLRHNSLPWGTPRITRRAAIACNFLSFHQVQVVVSQCLMTRCFLIMVGVTKKLRPELPFWLAIWARYTPHSLPPAAAR
jgi:hypothetical protein